MLFETLEGSSFIHSSVGTEPHMTTALTTATDWPKASGRCFDKISHQQNASAGSLQLKSLVETLGKGWQSDL